MSDSTTQQKLPFSLESEQALLGGVMMDSRAWDEIADIVNKNDFYAPKNQIIFHAIADLINHNEPADMITINTYLAEHGQLDEAGGANYLTQININAPSISNIKAYANQIREDSIKRALLNSISDIGNKVHQPDGTNARDILDFAEQQIFAISEKASKNNNSIHIKEGLQSVINEAKRIEEEGIQSIKTGFTELDNLTSGFHSGDLIIIASRPSMGKTAFSMNIVEHIAIHTTLKKPVAVFSLEMSAEQLLMRMISSYGRIDSQKIRRGEMNDKDWKQFTKATNDLFKGDVIIDETASITPLEIRAKCRRIKREYPNLGLVMIDYLQLMNKATGVATATLENRNQEISQISRALKALARELEIPIVVLSQLNRAVEGRDKDNKGRMPQMADLRDSGAIEQDADMILFIYRDEVYHDQKGKNNHDQETHTKTDKKQGYYNPSEIGKADIKLAKNRNGPIGNVSLRFEKQFARFENRDKGYHPNNDYQHADDGYPHQAANFGDDEVPEDTSMYDDEIRMFDPDE